MSRESLRAMAFAAWALLAFYTFAGCAEDETAPECEALDYGSQGEAYEACEQASARSVPVTCTERASVTVIHPVNGVDVVCECADDPCPPPGR